MFDNVIKAAQGEGDKKETFETSEKWPENIDEAISIWGEDEVLRLACRQKVVAVQANLRRPADRKTMTTKDAYTRMLDSGISEADARKISQYNGD